MRHRPLAAILFTVTLAASACQLVWSYDDFKDQPGTGGSASSSSSSGGGSTSSSGGGFMSSSSTSTTSGCTLDDDMDQVLSWKCDPADATLDCADEDDRAFPDAGFRDSPIVGKTRPGTQPWDFDCDGTIVQETPVLYCGGFWCGGSGFQDTGAEPVCGMAYTLGHCANTGWLGSCQWSANNPLEMRTQRCK